MNKIFAIGDIHGCLEKLQTLMKKIDIDYQKDILIFIGDYIDRGRSSREVIDYIIRLREKSENVICLMGNHEQMFMNYLDGVNEGLYLGNGGRATLESYGILLSDNVQERKAKVSGKHLQFFRSLLPYYESDQYVFVHAGVRSELPLNEQAIDDLLWIRFEFIHNENDFGKTVVFGHTPMRDLMIEKNKIGIDTGAIYGGKLTCVELPDVKIYQA